MSDSAMGRTKRWLWRLAWTGLAALFLLPLLGWMNFVFGRVHPALPMLEAALRAAPAEDRDPPELVRQLLRADQGEAALRWNVARLLYHGFDPVGMEGGEGNWGWHKYGTLWNLWLRWQRTARDCESMAATFAHSGEGRQGLSNASQLLFHKPLSQLSAAEAAEVVVILRSPHRFLKDAERRGRQRDLLLAKAGVSTQPRKDDRP